MLKFSEIFEFSRENSYFERIQFEWFEWFEWFGPSPTEPFNSAADGEAVLADRRQAGGGRVGGVAVQGRPRKTKIINRRNVAKYCNSLQI